MTAIDGSWVKRWLMLTRDRILEHHEELTELDRQIGDADHGDNLNRGFAAVAKMLQSEDAPSDAPGILKDTARTLISTVGGAAGPLYGTAFLRAAGVAPDGDFSGADIAAMLGSALEGIQKRGKAQTGEKTMVDTWAPAYAAAKESAEKGNDCATVLQAATDAAEIGAQSTFNMRATKGRASYLGERSIGHLDPGAVSSSVILRAALDALHV